MNTIPYSKYQNRNNCSFQIWHEVNCPQNSKRLAIYIGEIIFFYVQPLKLRDHLWPKAVCSCSNCFSEETRGCSLSGTLKFTLSDLARDPRGGVRPPPQAASPDMSFTAPVGADSSAVSPVWGVPCGHQGHMLAEWRPPENLQQKNGFIWFTPYFSTFLTRRARPLPKNFWCTLVFVECNFRVKDFRTKSHRG